MTETNTHPGPVHRGPPLSALASIHVALFLASLVVLGIAGEGSSPLPGADPGSIADHVAKNAGVLRAVGMLQFGAAVPLALFAATASGRLRHLGVRAAGTTITLTGGLVAAAMLATTGLLTVASGTTGSDLDGPTAAALHNLTFFVGGAGYIVFFGLVLAGVAITARFAGLLPNWLCWAGLAVFGVAELSALSLAVEPLTFTIPLARFAGMAVLVAIGVRLPSRRPAAVETHHR